MNLINTIKQFKSFNEEEQAYKESFLQFFNKFAEKDWATRDNLIGHLTSSAWVVNKDKSKVLFAYHNIYKSWAWLGGHADDDLDLLHVACKEACEESGIKNVKPIIDTPIDLSIQLVASHYKKEKHIPAHLHYNVTYLLEANENETLEISPNENSAVKWIKTEELLEKSSEEAVRLTYARIMQKVASLN